MAMPGELDHDRCLEETCGEPLDLQVCMSAAGYYLGTECDFHGPNSRESGYFASAEEAEAALVQWHEGNKVGKRDTDFHAGEMKVIDLGENPSLGDIAAAFGITEAAGHTVLKDNPLTAQKVEAVLLDCFFTNGLPDQKDMIIVQGVLNSFAFSPAKIEEHSDEIHAMLLELPKEFQETLEEAEGEPGGGTSFLNMCIRKDGEMWTGMHMVQEQLLVLGLASGWARYPLPRSMWPVLHGGMPYVTVCGTRQTVEHVPPEQVAEVVKQVHDHPTEG